METRPSFPGFEWEVALTPALSRPTGEGDCAGARGRIPSPIRWERFRVALVAHAFFVISVSTAAEVARVGDTIITPEAVQQTVARNGYNLYDPASVHKALGDAIQFELLATEAKKLGLDKDAAVSRQIKEILVQRLIREKIEKQLVSYRAAPETARAYFSSHTNEFRKPALARGTIITILSSEGKKDESKAKAAKALADLKTASQPEAVVRAYSDDPSEKVNGGLSEFFVEGTPSRRYPPAVQDAMLALRLRGDTAGPIATPRAFYAIRLVERRDAKPMPFEQVEAEIYKRLAQEQREKLLKEYCESLKKHIPVSVEDAQVQLLLPKAANNGGPPPVPDDAP